jgi:pimeloyl-ACP methyl ester carboxylesterase
VKTDSRSPGTVLLIHGLWMTPRSWEKWAERYRSLGYEVLVPAWPGMEGEVEELNRDSSPIAELEITQIIDHYEAIIRGLERPPIIMGHSLGGTIIQVLLDRGLAAAGVGVAPGTVKGVPDLPLTTLRSTAPVLRNPLNRHKAVPLDREQFHYAFTNTLDRDESDTIYDRYHVPCAVAVLRAAAFAGLHRDAPTKVDFARTDRAPLLFISFSQDHIVPPSASRHNAEKYEGPAVVEFKEFPDRPHFPGVDGWEEVADYAIEWAASHAAAKAAA